MRKSVILVLLAASSVFPQARDTASLSGSVSDSQGARIPNAPVTIVNAATGLTRNVATDANGAYTFALLPVGSYTLTVEQTGFRKYERRGITLQANENIQVDISLAIGNVQETVTIDAQASMVDTRAATLNHTVDTKRIVELPLNGRNPADLVLLAPGVASGATNNTAMWGIRSGVQKVKKRSPSTDPETTI